MRIPKYLLTDTCEVRACTGHGAYEPIFADPVTYRCRIEFKQILATDKEGKEVTAAGRIFFEPEAVCPVDSRIIIGGAEYTAVSSNPQKGFRPSHIEVIFR